MPKFTKGPWQVGSYKGVINGDVHEALSIWPSDALKGDSGRHVCLIGPLDVMDDLDIANANLIAAAPELYAACEAAFIRLPMTKHNEELNEQLKAAMTKARGDNL